MSVGRLSLFVTAALLLTPHATSSADSFYVDSVKGSDFADGTLDSPFRTLQHALRMVSARVEQGHRSDKIFLRGGVYKHTSTETLYTLNLKGTPEDYALLSAMPCAPEAPGGVQRKSGRWYEKVVFDDAWEITTPWHRVPGREDIWQTNPGFGTNEWPDDKVRWAWYAVAEPEKVGRAHQFTLAPFMIEQDGDALVWARTLEEMVEPGVRTYDFKTGTLYVFPFGGKNPNECTFESWYGGPDKNGYLLRDGEGRGLFKGDLEYAAIQGFEFRMMTRIFEFVREGYAREKDREIQRHVRFEDNVSRYCYISLLLDANTVFANQRSRGLIPPRFEDRSNWVVRNNIFYRPTKECFQVHGRNHVFEYNEIIDHGGPWAGPAARVGATNARNMQDVVFRHNFILGQGKGPYARGSVFMIEAEGGHVDENGDNIFGGVTYEGNIFANMTKGPAIVAGKGGCRMRDITIRNNIFKSNSSGPAIQLASPHINLRIENNIFYDQTAPIRLVDENRSMPYNALPSTISIRNNLFVRNARTIDRGLLATHSDSVIAIERNLFFHNLQDGLGDNILSGDPLFRDPDRLDFRLQEGSPAIVDGRDLGPYDSESGAPPGTAWWEFASKY